MAQEKHIFITGASRSGTTMLSRIFNQHPDVFSLNELHVFGDLIKADKLNHSISVDEQKSLATKIIQRQYYGIWRAKQPLNENKNLPDKIIGVAPTKRTAAEVYKLCVDEVAKQEGKVIACEQTPRNVFYAEQLLASFSQAHIVHIIRDPRSVLASQKNKWRRRFLGGDDIPWLEVIRMWCNYHPITLSKMWLKANQTAFELRSHPRVHQIKFETLGDAPTKELKELCYNLGLKFHPEMLEITHVGSSHQHNRSESKGISTTSGEGWKQNLSDSEIAVSQNICQHLISQYDYPLLDDQPRSMIGMALIWIRFPVHLLGVAIFNTQRAKIQILSMLGKPSWANRSKTK